MEWNTLSMDSLSITQKETQGNFQQRQSFHIRESNRRSLQDLFNPDPPSYEPESKSQNYSYNANLSTPVVNLSRVAQINTPSYCKIDPVDNVFTPTTKRELPPIVHDVSFIDMSMFTPGCLVCQVQFKHVYRDYVISEFLLKRNDINVGEFLVTISHLDSKTIDLGVVTALYTVDEFFQLKRLLGRSQDQEENFIGTVIRVATMDERSYLPAKWEREVVTLDRARQVVYNLGLQMNIYCAEYQLDGKVLYLYYTADNRVDYRGLVHEMARSFANVRVKMKKTNQCRKFIPHEFASVGLATGYLPMADDDGQANYLMI